MNRKNTLLAMILVVLLSAVGMAQSGVRGTASSATWTTSTAINTVLSYDLTNTQYEGIYVYISGGASLTAGAVTFEAGPSSSAVTTTQMTRTDSSTNDGSYTLVSSIKQGWTGSIGPPYFQIRLSTAIAASAGVGTTTVTIIPYSFPNQKDVVASVSSSGNATSSNQTSGAQKGQVCQSDGTCAPVDAVLGLKVQASIDTTGLSTSAKQDTGNTSLGTIATNTTGAATAAKQPSLGTAGSPSTNVISVQGVTSGTKIPVAYSDGTSMLPTDTVLVTPSSATAPVSTMNSASANSGVNSPIAAVFDDSSPTSITENSFGFLRMSANRNLYNTIRDAAGNERGMNVDSHNNTGSVNYNSSGTEVGTSAAAFVVQGAVGGVGLPVIVACGTATEIQGTAVVTGTGTSNLTFLMADGTSFTAKASNRIEIHSYQTVNTGATNALITFTMDNSVPTILAYGVAPTSTTPFGGSNVNLPTPMFTTVQNKAMSIAASGSSTSIYVTAQGCIVP